MADSLFFRKSDSGFEWLRFNGQGQLLSQGTSELEELDFEGRAVYVVPGSDVLLTTAAVPSRQYRRIAQAVPYMIEENLAVDVEDCFFALGDRTAQGDIEVAVVGFDIMQSWFDEIEQPGLNVTALITEHELVNAEADSAVVLDRGQAHIDLAGNGSVTLPEIELRLAAAGLEEGDVINVWTSAAITVPVDLQLKELEAAGFRVERQESSESPFERLCRGYSGTEINLLQGVFKKQEHRSEGFNMWKSVATLAVAALFLHVFGLVGQGWYLHSKAADFEVETRAIYAKTFPNDRNVRDIRRRWNSHLGKQETTDNVFISLLSRSTRQLAKPGLSLVNINFNESRGDLVLQVLGKQSEALVEYSQTLIGQGLEAEIGTITQDDRGVRGSIRVRDPS